ncbi:MAG: FAD-dependent monooxygenase [Pseudomonadota bacterium]
MTGQPSRQTAVIVGGGIAGRAAALALHRVGISATILEARAQTPSTSAGIQLSPNAMRVIEQLGVAEHLAANAVDPKQIRIRDARTASILCALPLGSVAPRRWGERYWVCHRNDLAAALDHAIARRQSNAGGVSGTAQDGASPTIEIRRGARVVELEQTGSPTVVLDDGSRVSGDFIVGADGMRSTVRRCLFDDGAPRDTGFTAYRTVLNCDDLSSSHTAVSQEPAVEVWAAERAHMVTYPVSAGRALNVVAIVEGDGTPAGEKYETAHRRSVEGWETSVPHERLANAFADACSDVRAITAAARIVHAWPLFDRAPRRVWSHGRAVLIGDAAHPMLPSMAQGAAMALEDAWSLAQVVRYPTQGAQPLVAAFENLTATRRDRTARVQRRAAQNLSMFHRHGLLGRLRVDLPLRIAGLLAPALLVSRQDWIYAHDVTKT